jgi:23S rRNA (uracil747-C5)-methyltransferase
VAQAQLPQLKVITANIQPVHMAIMEGERRFFFTEQQALAENFNGVPLWIRPQSFFQTNPSVASRCTPPPATGCAAAGQAYVGSVLRRGGFGLHCATPQMRLTGIEIAPEAIACAKQSAAELGLSNLHFQALDSTQFATARARFLSWCWSTRRAVASAASCATI